LATTDAPVAPKAPNPLQQGGVPRDNAFFDGHERVCPLAHCVGYTGCLTRAMSSNSQKCVAVSMREIGDSRQITPMAGPLPMGSGPRQCSASRVFERALSLKRAHHSNSHAERYLLFSCVDDFHTRCAKEQSKAIAKSRARPSKASHIAFPYVHNNASCALYCSQANHTMVWPGTVVV
jgi:hypothetical protein